MADNCIKETANSRALGELSLVLEGNVLNSIRAARYARIEFDHMLERRELTEKKR